MQQQRAAREGGRAGVRVAQGKREEGSLVSYNLSAQRLRLTLSTWEVHRNSPVGDTLTPVTARLNTSQSTHAPVGRCQTRRLASTEAVTSRRPSLEKAMSVTCALWPDRRRTCEGTAREASQG